MSYRTVLLAVLSANVIAGGAFAELPTGRWYKVDAYNCRAFRDYVDHRPSVIGTQFNISQRACATLCNGTPNCAAYNYLVRVDRSGRQAKLAQECQLLKSADQRVSTFPAAPGESAYVCYKGSPTGVETPDLDADARRSFQDSLRPNLPTPPAPPPVRND